MTRYQLAKLVGWADTLRSRKRLQKVVYLLQASGCPLATEFSLHHYGPYSEELARLTDEMVRQSFLAEQSTDNQVGRQYIYRLAPTVPQQIGEIEATGEGRQWASELAPFEERAKQLLREDLKQLEYASTIVFFRRQGVDWATAVEKAEQFKRTGAVRDALPLAQQTTT